MVVDEMKIGEARERLHARYLVYPDSEGKTDLSIRLVRGLVAVVEMKLGEVMENFQTGYLIGQNDLQILVVLMMVMVIVMVTMIVAEMKLGQVQEGLQAGYLVHGY